MWGRIARELRNRGYFATDWQRFKTDHAKLKLQLDERHFPYMFKRRITPQRAALVWDGDTTGLALDATTDPDVPLPYYEYTYTANSPLLATDDPYLLVSYSV
jgi:hypothetical protein